MAATSLCKSPAILRTLYARLAKPKRWGGVSFSSLRKSRDAQASQICKLPEVRWRETFYEQLKDGTCDVQDFGSARSIQEVGLNHTDVLLGLDASLATFLLHVESRIASLCGEGFYTIGPCGEELLAGVGMALRSTDAVALHYRHLGTSVARALQSGKAMDRVLLDRARGFCVSTLDPVSRGHHCLLGGGPADFVVTSTLASQACPAVGRAAGLRLAHALGSRVQSLAPDAVSYVSIGDGSINNAHFLSAVNIAEYMQHRGFQCPVVFGISDNGVCISLRGHDWLSKFSEQRLGMSLYRADGNDLLDVYHTTREAVTHSRRHGVPVAVIFQGLVRRFGHAATDRQDAYLSQDEISSAESRNALAGECARAVRRGVVTYDTLAARFRELWEMTAESFDKASAEPKITERQECIQMNSRPTTPRAYANDGRTGSQTAQTRSSPQVMRRSMTRILDELLSAKKELVYIGEDVQHGGYYRVTEGLHEKYGFRVADFPPDETSLLGTAIGYAQVGLLPIVELPYAKYLDCGADMFFEAVIANWLSAGRQPCGMVIRLQGFDKGVFGGNFHTHNMLHLPPGLDVVAYSNGADYVRGMRYAVLQAAGGRVVMVVDSTDLLNRRHLFERDDAWMRPYPSDPNDMLEFDQVQTYGEGSQLAIVSYGNGVPAALRAKKNLERHHGAQGVVVIDAPLLSDIPAQLCKQLSGYTAVLFADVCKLGQNPYAGAVVKLQAQGLLPQQWQCVAAAPTYNPLGSTITFLNEDDILTASLKLLKSG